MENSILNEYFAALERIKNGNPIRVSKGSKISKDSVAIEAGRKKGSIKKSRDSFSDLIEAINIAAKSQNNISDNNVDKLKLARQKSDQYRNDLEAALAREICLLHELYELKKQLAKLTGTNVIPIRKN